MLKTWRPPWILKLLPVWFVDAYHYRRYFKGCKLLQYNFPALRRSYEPVCFDAWRPTHLNPRMPYTAPSPAEATARQRGNSLIEALQRMGGLR